MGLALCHILPMAETLGKYKLFDNHTSDKITNTKSQ